MKKITLIVSLLFFSLSWSQKQEQRNTQFDLLQDKTQTKILYNRVAPIAKLTDLKKDAFNTLYYKQAYYEIQRSDFLNRLPNYEVLEKATEKGFATNIVPISILISEFETLKRSVKEQNQLQLNSNNQFEPIANNIDLFDIHKIALASPLIKQIKGTYVKFKLEPDLIFNTTNKSIQKIEYRLNNTEYTEITPNTIISLNNIPFGKNQIEFKITLNNGEIFTNKSQLNVSQKATPIDYAAKISLSNAGTVGPVTSITSSLTYQGYDETAAYAGEGEFQIYYDNEAGLLDKIVIVCDGFDPGDGRDTSAIYNMLNYGSENLGDNVRDLGYDMVVLNFPQYTRPDGITNIDGGVDYIQRNARVLIELINYLNTNKVGNQELVVIGPSMGGLISRYALRYMEMNGMDHHTRLWLSFDSPHLGANVPIGMQHLFNYIGYGPAVGDLTVKAVVDAMLKSPAAREMLIDHFEGHLQTDGSSDDLYEFNSSIVLPTGHPTHRNVFQTELNTMGFPQNLRRIAISNGASNGTMTGSPGMVLLDWTYDQDFWTRAIMQLWFTPTTNTQIRVSRFRGQLWTIWWNTIYDSSAYSKSTTTSAGLDSAPGGQFDLNSLGDSAGGNELIETFLDELTIKEFDFIPAKSSLAVASGNNWYANITSSNVTNFDAYYAPTTNEHHVTLTPANVAFALNEIVTNIQLKCTNSTVWNGSNWSNGAPNEDTQVIFNGNYTSNTDLDACSVTVNGSSVVTFLSGHNLTVRGKITVATTAQLNMENNANIYQIEEVANTGNIQMKRDVSLKRLDYIGWSSPVNNQNLKAFSPETLDNRFYIYNPSGTSTATAYQSVNPNTNSFEQAKGYVIRAGNTMPATTTSWTGIFNGTPFNGRINPTIVFDNSMAETGYNVVGNPYPSPLNIQEFIVGNENTIDGTVYFWTNTNAPVGGIYTINNFASRNLTGGTAAVNGTVIPDTFIQTGQGFYVHALASGPMFFTNSMRNKISSNQFMFKNTESAIAENYDKFWLNLSQNGNPHNEMLIGYMPNATNNLDFGYDGKLLNNGSAAIYSIVQNENLVIQGRTFPFTNEDIIPLGFKTNSDGTFTISLGNVEGAFSTEQPIYLKDKLTGSFINLQNEDYLFIAKEGTTDDRFELVFKKENNTVTDSNDQILVYSNQNNLVFDSTKNKIQKIEIFDTLGRLLFSKNDIDSNYFSTNSLLKSNNVILIKIIDEERKETKTKLIF